MDKVKIPVLNTEQKEQLFSKLDKTDNFLPKVNSSYRWNLKISKDVFVVFELELQKRHLLFWKRSVSYYVSLDMLKKMPVETCLTKCAEDLLNMEEDKLRESSVNTVDWVSEVS